jgi:hypothetical protein
MRELHRRRIVTRVKGRPALEKRLRALLVVRRRSGKSWLGYHDMERTAPRLPRARTAERPT